jgi:hypothetical protein
VSAIDDIKTEAQQLLARGVKFLNETKEPINLANFRLEYEPWYTQAHALIIQVVPERAEAFRDAYRPKRPKEITYDTYGINDFMLGLVITRGGRPVFNTFHAFLAKLMAQVGILRAAVDTLPSMLRDIRTVLRAELFDNDIAAALELAKKKHLRSAGVVCGVVLEGHLKSVADRRGITFTKKHLTISDLNDRLKTEKVYDVPMWRFIQRLADIRNLCGHAGEREPTAHEVEVLLNGTDKVIKEVW